MPLPVTFQPHLTPHPQGDELMGTMGMVIVTKARTSGNVGLVWWVSPEAQLCRLTPHTCFHLAPPQTGQRVHKAMVSRASDGASSAPSSPSEPSGAAGTAAATTTSGRRRGRKQKRQQQQQHAKNRASASSNASSATLGARPSMKALRRVYGKSAAEVIGSLETMLCARCDDLDDALKPPIWPELPLC